MQSIVSQVTVMLVEVLEGDTLRGTPVGAVKMIFKNFCVIIVQFENLTGCSGIEYQNARLYRCSIELVILSHYGEFVGTKFFEVSKHN